MSHPIDFTYVSHIGYDAFEMTSEKLLREVVRAAVATVGRGWPVGATELTS